MTNKRVLIVAPRFPPVNAPDAQRARGLLPYLPELGWRVDILAVEPRYVVNEEDSALARLIPHGVEVWRTNAVPVKFGVGSLALRCLPYFVRTGNRLLSEREYDLVFFSTTEFPVMILGPYWKRKYGVPYVVDLQDPWVTDYYDQLDAPVPPGGKVKYGIMRALAKRLEPIVMRYACHIVCVSSTYVHDYMKRYSDLVISKFSVVPFGAPTADWKELGRLGINQDIFDPNDGLQHWVHVGRINPQMLFSVTALLRGIRKLRDLNRNLADSIRLHFVGTNYETGDRPVPVVGPVAEKSGVADLVTERPERVSYFAGLACLRDAGAVFVLGSVEPGYTPSKINLCVMTGKPLLALSHSDSGVPDGIRRYKAGEVIEYHGTGEPELDRVSDMIASLISTQGWPRNSDTDWEKFESQTDRAMATTMARLFECCETTSRNRN